MSDPNSPDAADSAPEPDDVMAELAALRQQVSRLNGQRFLRMHNSMARLIWVQFVKGLALGLARLSGRRYWYR